MSITQNKKARIAGGVAAGALLLAVGASIGSAAAPVTSGDPGYGSHLDRDGDGVGCE